MSKKLSLLLIIVLIALVILAGWLFTELQSSSSGTPRPSPYSVVYLSTGEIYFGELSWFPRLKLKNVWFIRQAAGGDQATEPELGILPLNSVFWGPVDELNLNAKEVIFWARLRSDSQVAAALQSQKLTPGLPIPDGSPVPGEEQ